MGGEGRDVMGSGGWRCDGRGGRDVMGGEGRDVMGRGGWRCDGKGRVEM